MNEDQFDEKREIISQLKDKLKLQSEVIEEMKAALAFYSDKENWDDDKFCPTIWDEGSIDLGIKATKALESVSKKLGNND